MKIVVSFCVFFAVLTAPVAFAGVGDVRLGGAVGRKADALLSARVLSECAQGVAFEEAERAFATHYDDVNPKGGLYWQGEYWGKTMLGYTGAARYLHSADLTRFVREKSLKLLKEHQQEDGYLGTYSNKYATARGWNLWGRKYTLWALVEAYDLTGDKEILLGATRLARQFIGQLRERNVELAQTGCFSGMPTMSVLKPMLLLYARTKEPAFLDFAREIVSANDRADGAPPNLIRNAFREGPVDSWYQRPEQWAKAYEMMSCYEGFVAYARLVGEKRPLEAAERFYGKLADFEDNRLFGVGFYDKFLRGATCPNATTEMCDVIHWMRLCRALYEATGKARYLDAFEAAFYNAFLAGVHRDGAWGAHNVRSHGRRHLTGLYEAGMVYHFCCIDNAPRAFYDWAETSFVRDGGILTVNFYSDATYAQGGVKVVLFGDYPVKEHVSVRVDAPEGVRLRFRVPGWCPSLLVDGRPVAGGWFETEVRGGKTFALDFAMPVRVVDTVLADAAGAVREVVSGGADLFEMPRHNPEMAGMARTKPGARILKGPLVLAKCVLAGATEEEIFDPSTVNGRGRECRVTLAPIDGKDVWGAWRLTLTDGRTTKSTCVSDFSSAADFESWRNAFSIWF